MLNGRFAFIFTFCLFSLMCLSPISLAFCGEICEISHANTAPLETDVHSLSVIQTMERLKQLKQSVLFESHPISTESPSYDFDFLLPKDEKTTYPISKTSEPFLKEQLIASKGLNITPQFEEIFLLLSDEARVKACQRIFSEAPQDFVKKFLHYLGKGTPEQALILNQIIPRLKQELEDTLVILLQEDSLNLQEKRTIIYALGRMKSEKSVSLLWNEIQSASSEEIQYNCVQALANMPHSLSLEQWVQLLQYDSIPISLTSAYAIVEYGGSSAEEYIRRTLLGEFRVSQRVLEYFTDRVSTYPLDIFVPFSIEVMSRNSGLAPKFAGILHQRTGVNFGPNPQLWANWWKEYLNNTSSVENSEQQPPPQNNPLMQPDVKVHQPKIRKR